MTKQICLLGPASAFLLVLCACGGGKSSPSPPPPAPATRLVYANPAGIPVSAYTWNKNTTLSQGPHLVLELYGPATAVTASGVVVTLTLDTTKASWGNPSGSSPVANGHVFRSNPKGDPVVQGRITGGTLQAVVTERGVDSAKPMIGPLLQVALDLNTGQTIGTVIALTADLARSKVLVPGASDPSPMQDLRVGTLTAQ